MALAAPARAAAAAPWLFVSDIHLDALAHNPRPASFGSDTNPALLRSALAEMQRTDPNPPVIVLGGDFVAHNVKGKRVAPTLVLLAQLFNRAFPAAQFVVTLGNNDSACGDYVPAPDSALLRTVAQAWAPLVNRRSADPDFARTFAHDGFSSVRLPRPGLSALTPDDTSWSVRAHACGTEPSERVGTVTELRHALLADGAGRRWILLHIPPGVDAFSSVQISHNTMALPLLDPAVRDQLEALAGDPAHGAALVIAGHIHRFSYRILNANGPHPVPVLTIPAISPIFGNAPSFLTVDVGGDGTIANAEEHSFVNGAWSDIGGLRSLGVTSFTAAQLLALQERLLRSAPLRETYSRLYTGAGRPEISERNWRPYWCAATDLGATSFRECAGMGGFSTFTQRGLLLGTLAIVVVAFLAAVLIFRLRSHTRSRRPAP